MGKSRRSLMYHAEIGRRARGTQSDHASEPSLLEKLPYKAHDPTSSLGVIADDLWEKLALLVDLPECARYSLEHTIQTTREKYWGTRNEAPYAVQKDLKSLIRHARKLSEGLRQMGNSARSALMLARDSDEILLLSSPDIIEDEVATIEKLHRQLTRAFDISKSWKPNKMVTLQEFIKDLDGLLVSTIGRGLVRSSEPTKTSHGRSTDCFNFVVEMVMLTFGRRPRASIDEAIKQAISERRNSVTVGK